MSVNLSRVSAGNLDAPSRQAPDWVLASTIVFFVFMAAFAAVELVWGEDDTRAAVIEANSGAVNEGAQIAATGKTPP